MLSRRTFVSWLSGFGAALGIATRARTGEAKATADAAPPQAALDAAVRLAEAVRRVNWASGFTRVVAGSRSGSAGIAPARKWSTRTEARISSARVSRPRAGGAPSSRRSTATPGRNTGVASARSHGTSAGSWSSPR
jgi:hypothetical protein